MDIGVYNLKYPFRKLINFLLPFFKNTDPNHISLALIPLEIVIAFVYYFSPETPALYLLGIVLLFGRMVIGTLDGLVAVTFGKSTAKGEILNRIAPEIGDILLMMAIVYTNPDYAWLGIGVFAVCWATTFFGLIGLAGGKTTQSVGPVGQTDRIVALMVFSLLQYLGKTFDWEFDFINLFLWWALVGGIVTILIRTSRVLKTE